MSTSLNQTEMSQQLNMAEMQSYLVDLDLTRIALCGAGCNTRADIILTKRKENPSMSTTISFEDIQKSLEPSALDTITKHFEELQASALQAKDAEIADLNKSISELTAEVNALKKSTTDTSAAAEPDADSILKGLPEEVADLFKSQQEMLKQLIEKDQEATAQARFDAVKSIPVEENELKEVLKTASPAAYNVLLAAAEAINKNVTVEPVGSDATGELDITTDSAYAALEKSAKAYQAAHPDVSFEQAFSQACTLNPSEYLKYTKGV